MGFKQTNPKIGGGDGGISLDLEAKRWSEAVVELFSA